VSRKEVGPMALYRAGSPPRAQAGPLRVALLGATGSIGRQAVELALRYPDRLRIVAVSARSRVKELAHLVDLLAGEGGEPPAVALGDEKSVAEAAGQPLLRRKLLAPGAAGLREAAALPEADCVLNALVGAAGLEPTLVALESGKRLALANKESLVVGGLLVRDALVRGGGEVIPVDSEHSAIAQCLSGRDPGEVESVILTASGGPFRTLAATELRRVTLESVLRHPTWEMGPKITVDSATLMNKGLEIIEAHYLFDMPYDDIQVVIHPSSVIHSLVCFQDGAVMAQLGAPDMKVPLLFALAGERHWHLPTRRLDLVGLGSLHFEAPDADRFPCLRLAREAGRLGGRAPIVLNAANEIAVAALLAARIRYVDIASVIERTLESVPSAAVADLEEALAADRLARETASAFLD